MTGITVPEDIFASLICLIVLEAAIIFGDLMNDRSLQYKTTKKVVFYDINAGYRALQSPELHRPQRGTSGRAGQIHSSGVLNGQILYSLQ